ncbi:AI-2E family transporter [Micromonospora sp. NPDC049366]|uniref:AI-2E family transporter n=1 Tax=Micromonospora sp. NPDC049366 TaxID=3364271 RepID=UPI0037A4C2DA
MSHGPGRARPPLRGLPVGLLRAAVVCGSALVVAVTLALAVWALARIGPVTLAVAAALLAASLLMPLVDRLARLRLPRALAALAGVLVLVLVLVLPLALLGQQLVDQFDDLGRQLDEGIARTRSWLVGGPLPIDEKDLDAVWAQFRAALSRGGPDPAASAYLAVETVGAIALALVLLFLILKDGHRMWAWVVDRLPERHRSTARLMGTGGWDALSGYMRGTLLVAAVDAAGIGLALFLVGVPLVLPLAFLTFVSAFIPIIGATLAGAAAVLVALVADGPTAALIVLAAVIGVQQAEGNLLQPLIMGHTVRLHPAVILVAVSAGAVLAGVAGALVSVPLVAASYRALSALAAARDGPTEP